MKNTFTFLLFFYTLIVYSQKNKRDIDSIERIIKTSTDKDRILSEKAALVTELYSQGEQEKSESLYKDAFKEASALNSQMGLGALYHARGNLFYYQSNFDSALFYFEKALVIRKKIKDDVGILKTTGNIGSIYYLFGDHKKALIYYEEALKKEAELGYEEGKYVYISNLGSLYYSLKMYDRSLFYFLKSEKRYSKSPGKLIFVYSGVANIYKDLNKLDSATYFIFKAKDIAESVGDERSFAYCLNDIGALFLKQKKYDLAKANFKSALEHSYNVGDTRLDLSILGNLSVIEMENNRLDSSMFYIEKVIALQNKLKIIKNREDLSRLFAEFYYRKKDYEKAWEYVQKYDRFKDSTYNLETTAQINEMQEKYETDKKEKENQLLQIENKGQKTIQNYLLIILGIALAGITGAVVAYKKIKTTNHLLEIQKELVEEKQKEILDSIHYARRIQFALLASDSLLNAHLPEHFVLFKPKDVVSGDFYWATPTPTGFVYITADCTGHGVPGAFMSLLNISKLSQIVNENKIDRPDLVLNNMRTEIIKVLNPENSKEESKDGMDAVLCKLNLKEMKLEYAAANNSFYIIRNKALLECKADKMPVGKGHDDSMSFTYNEIALQKGDTIYTFTDGFADQFGGKKGKKFKYKQLEELLLSVHQETMANQKQKLSENFEAWKGTLEQVDDVCVIGIRI